MEGISNLIYNVYITDAQITCLMTHKILRNKNDGLLSKKLNLSEH